jgi:hypothetical protein
MFSFRIGEKKRKKSLSFTNTGKLETQNGMAKNRNVCHLFGVFTIPLIEQNALMFNTNPTRRAIPSDRTQSSTSGSKYL